MITSVLSIILPAASLPIARAAPWRTVYARQSNGNDNSGGMSLSTSIWVPVVFIGGLFLVAAVWVLQRKMAGSRADANGNAVSNNVDSTTTGQARELTATELAGDTRPATTRRTRRPRRTPSQVSTRSLPAYMKEPGDNEVVIYRSGLEDMEEEADGEPRNAHNMPADTTMGTDRTDRDSHDDTRSLLPLRTDSPEFMRQSIRLSRGSYDQQGSDDSHAQLIDVQRGEAPAYETIDLNATEGPVPAQNHQNSQPMRMPGFLSRFMPGRGNSSATNEPSAPSPQQNSQNPALSPSHSRQPSVQSGVSGIDSADSHTSVGRSRDSRTHRNNNSSSGSVFTLFGRTLSRNPGDVELTSPSMISLNSISPPLTHTATRTEFTYPRTGPTSDQVKFLSSKETFGRFGVPYGPDAIAFAASSSRLDLPPDFDSVHRPSFSDLVPSTEDGTAPGLSGSSNARGIGTDANSDGEGSPFPESVEPSPDPASPPDQLSGPNLEGGTATPLVQSSLSKQKSAPNLGMGHPSQPKSPALKSKSVANFRSGGDGSMPLRSASAAGSYLTVESFQTAHDEGDDSVPSQLPGPVPHITVQLPSNNPSLANLTERSDSEAEFFDGEEGTEDSEVEGGERGTTSGRENKTPRAVLLHGGSQSHIKGRNLEAIEEGDQPHLSDGDRRGSSTSASNSMGSQDAGTNASSYSPTSDSDSGSDNVSEAETRSNQTEMDKTMVTTDPEAGQIQHAHGGADLTLTKEMVAITLGTDSPDPTKTVGVSRTSTLKA